MNGGGRERVGCGGRSAEECHSPGCFAYGEGAGQSRPFPGAARARPRARVSWNWRARRRRYRGARGVSAGSAGHRDHRNQAREREGGREGGRRSPSPPQPSRCRRGPPRPRTGCSAPAVCWGVLRAAGATRGSACLWCRSRLPSTYGLLVPEERLVPAAPRTPPRHTAAFGCAPRRAAPRPPGELPVACVPGLFLPAEGKYPDQRPRGGRCRADFPRPPRCFPPRGQGRGPEGRPSPLYMSGRPPGPQPRDIPHSRHSATVAGPAGAQHRAGGACVPAGLGPRSR